MSSHDAHETYESAHDQESFVDTYWQIGLIAFALCFVTMLVAFAPTV